MDKLYTCTYVIVIIWSVKESPGYMDSMTLPVLCSNYYITHMALVHILCVHDKEKRNLIITTADHRDTVVTFTI